MKRLNFLIPVLGAAMAIFAGCSGNAGNDASQEATTQHAKENVKVIQLSKEEIARSVEYSSTLDPFNTVHLAPPSPGRIEAINVEIGDRVSKGELLAKMDDMQLIQSRIQFSNIETDKGRLDVLKKTGSVAQQQYDQLQTQYEVAKENVDYLKKNLVINAPFNGIISGKYFEPGEMYSGAPVAAAGKAAILSIIEIDKLKAIVNISEMYYPAIHKGMETKIKADVYPDLEFSGKISLIYPTINTQTRTFTVEITIDNPKNLLKPGMFCRVTIDLKQAEATVLPALAVLKMQGSNIRYLFKEENGKAKRVEVEMGQRFDDKVEVISNELKVGDNIIISGQEKLLDGMEVEVVK